MVVGSLPDPAQGLQLGQDDRGEAQLVKQGEAAQRVGPADQLAQLGKLALSGGLSGAGGLGPGQGDGPGVDRQLELGRQARGAEQAQRVLVETALAEYPQEPSLEVGEAPVGVKGRPPARGIATAPTVKSRAARSASIVSPRSAVASICQERSAPTTRQVPNSAESSKGCPPLSLAIAFAAAAGSPVTARSRSLTARPSAASRIAPPTIHTSPPPSRARRAKSTAGALARRSARLTLRSAAPAPRSRR